MDKDTEEREVLSTFSLVGSTFLSTNTPETIQTVVKEEGAEEEELDREGVTFPELRQLGHIVKTHISGKFFKM